MIAIETEANENECPACNRGEPTITPPHSSVVGSMPVHRPSGNVCMKYLKPDIVAILKNSKAAGAPPTCPSSETAPSNEDTHASHRA